MFLVAFVLWIAFQKDLSLSPYTPQQTFRSLGLSYSFILGYERNFHILLHLFVPFLMTILLYGSRKRGGESKMNSIIICVGIVLFLSLLTEAVQGLVGRNVELMDLVFDLLSVGVAAFVLSRCSTRN
jgi:VanZ family protein